MNWYRPLQERPSENDQRHAGGPGLKHKKIVELAVDNEEIELRRQWQQLRVKWQLKKEKSYKTLLFSMNNLRFSKTGITKSYPDRPFFMTDQSESAYHKIFR